MKIFTYGSNMNSRRLAGRVKTARFIDRGFVKEHKISFHKISKDGSGKADCFYTGSNEDKIWGIVLEIDDDEKSKLDKHEGLGKGYDEKEVTVHCGDRTHKALTYVANPNSIDANLLPYDWYLVHIIKGAEEFCLPLDYIEGTLKKVEFMADPDKERRKKEYEYLEIYNNDNMKMGGFKVHEWKELRKKLKGTTDYNPDWKKAAGWFEQRLEKRYFEPLREISPGISGVGFTITSILCVLIEHLAAAREGKIYNYRKKKGDPDYEYAQSKTFYENFLKTAKIFEGYFHTDDGSTPPFCSDDFYKNVRCALLHEACTKNNWIINTLNCHANPEKRIFIKDNRNKIIFRDVLLDKIIEYIDEYSEELKGNHQLRLNFARKMDSLCELEPDSANYEWWIDK